VDRILAHLSNIGEAQGALYSFNGTPAREGKNGHEQNGVTIPDVPVYHSTAANFTTAWYTSTSTISQYFIIPTNTLLTKHFTIKR